MSNYDRSSSRRTQMLKARTLAVYHNSNPTLNDYGGVKPSNDLTLLLRTVGEKIVCETCCSPVCDLSGAGFFPFDVTDIASTEEFLSFLAGQPIEIPLPPAGYPDERPGLILFFPEICNATTYTEDLVLAGQGAPQQQYFLGIYNTDFIWPRSGFFAIYPLEDYIEDTVSIFITASNECSSTTDEATFGCFLAGSQVALADGSFKAIEEVQVGDVVKGAFGETNTILALHRPLLGAGHVVNINGEHKTTSHHPHVSATRRFLCIEPNILKSFTYGKQHPVIVNRAGRVERRIMPGLKPERIQELVVGVELQTLTGARRVDTLEQIKMSPFTQVYHLVVGGSHTYVVDGYAVTGWAQEDDFNYDSWTPK